MAHLAGVQRSDSRQESPLPIKRSGWFSSRRRRGSLGRFGAGRWRGARRRTGQGLPTIPATVLHVTLTLGAICIARADTCLISSRARLFALASRILIVLDIHLDGRDDPHSRHCANKNSHQNQVSSSSHSSPFVVRKLTGESDFLIGMEGCDY
jgi:hypothetical protein